ncbi:TapB family protein [Mucilaginibacter ginsenosidivorax]|uniref:DUF3108 domain-containing protein n=1 Tax=Mucilaginibacter ginsenosidivorax TaxID=862126 RepID=A0A5B8W7R0_9SPHI|nr:hypothetical protein [Mucilaginibacter ginsenosidivorax]QEC78986.1 hypothetical protein FSB76_24680 [Mucilaginibacter ginsenosidivorax]
MKKLIILLLCTAVGMHTTSAQTCNQFINNVDGKKLSYINHDARGQQQMTAVYTSTKKDASTVAVHAVISDHNGKVMGTGDSEMICSGNVIKIDMKSFIPAASMKQYGDIQVSGEARYLTYPTDIKTGQTLDDGSVTINMNNGGAAKGEMQMDIVNRKVEATETVTTGAGTFDCFKIAYDATTTVKMAGISIPFRIKVTEWFAPKLGRFVKSETYNKNSKLMGTMTLESIN